MLIGHLATRWWAVALRGLVAVVFGVLALLLPGITLDALIILFGAYAFLDGVAALGAGVRGEGDGHSWLHLLIGVAGIAAGIVAWVWPGITALVLLSIIGAWAIITGLFEIAAAYRLRSALQHELLLAFDGILSIAFGIFVFVFPGAGALALIWLIGAYAIVSGLSLLLLGVRLRTHDERREAPV